MQHNHLNRKNLIQNTKCKCKNKINLFSFMHCTYKFEKYKQTFLGGNYEQTFPNKKHTQSNASEKYK
jgi:hypothetical protein